VRRPALGTPRVVSGWPHAWLALGGAAPTHQPIEHLTALRAIPGLAVVRPGDANETAQAWKVALERKDHPVALALTRQNLPTLDRTVYAPAENVAKGGYILKDASNGQPQVLIIATGSELQLAVTAQEQLEAAGTPTRVVSMPCQEWFEEQDEAYRQRVIPNGVKARVTVEAGIAMSWHKLLGDHGVAVSIEHYGASAPYQVLFEQFGFTPDKVVAAAHASLAKVGAITGSTTGN